MLETNARIKWKLQAQDDFLKQAYSRSHLWQFDSELVLEASASPFIVPQPFSNEKAIDPEEAFVASVASCHMLWFLAICAKKGVIVTHYEDNAVGILQKNAQNQLSITSIDLQPNAKFESDVDFKKIIHFHQQANPTRDKLSETML